MILQQKLRTLKEAGASVEYLWEYLLALRQNDFERARDGVVCGCGDVCIRSYES
jgi:hypothetical protein